MHISLMSNCFFFFHNMISVKKAQSSDALHSKWTYNPRIMSAGQTFVVCWLVLINFTHIVPGHFTGTGAITWLPQCHWSNPEGYRLNWSLSHHNKMQSMNHAQNFADVLYRLHLNILLVVMNETKTMKYRHNYCIQSTHNIDSSTHTFAQRLHQATCLSVWLHHGLSVRQLLAFRKILVFPRLTWVCIESNSEVRSLGS